MSGLRLECHVGGTAVCVRCYPSRNMVEILSGGQIPSVGPVRAARGQISSVASAESAKSAGKVCAGHGAVKTVVVEHGDVLSIEVDVPTPGLCGDLLCLQWGDFSFVAEVHVKQVWWCWWWRCRVWPGVGEWMHGNRLHCARDRFFQHVFRCRLIRFGGGQWFCVWSEWRWLGGFSGGAGGACFGGYCCETWSAVGRECSGRGAETFGVRGCNVRR